jgi:hypothetical protein
MALIPPPSDESLKFIQDLVGAAVEDAAVVLSVTQISALMVSVYDHAFKEGVKSVYRVS